MAEDRQGRAERIDAEDDGHGQPAAVERQDAPPNPWRHERADADQAPEQALCRGAATAVTRIGDHEGHVGDVAGAEQEIGDEVDRDRTDGKARSCGLTGHGIGAERRQQQGQDHEGREQRHRPPHDRPRARPERLQHERRDQTGKEDADAWSGVKQARGENWRARAAIARSWPRAPRRLRIPRHWQNPRAAVRSSARRSSTRSRTARATPRRPAFPSGHWRRAQSAGSCARRPARPPDSRPR